jgi:hypothetical protein
LSFFKVTPSKCRLQNWMETVWGMWFLQWWKFVLQVRCKWFEISKRHLHHTILDVIGSNKTFEMENRSLQHGTRLIELLINKFGNCHNRLYLKIVICFSSYILIKHVIIIVTSFLDFGLHQVLWKGHSIPETQSVSVLKWNSWECLYTSFHLKELTSVTGQPLTTWGWEQIQSPKCSV